MEACVNNRENWYTKNHQAST